MKPASPQPETVIEARDSRPLRSEGGCSRASDGSANEYNPVQCLRDEVQRFKDTNRFTPMLVTGFYIQAAVVLDYLKDMEETLDRLMRSADYACQHRYGEEDPVGTRIVAISDLHGALRHAKRMRRWPNEKADRSPAR